MFDFRKFRSNGSGPYLFRNNRLELKCLCSHQIKPSLYSVSRSHCVLVFSSRRLKDVEAKGADVSEQRGQVGGAKYSFFKYHHLSCYSMLSLDLK